MLSRLANLYEISCAKLSKYKKYHALYVERGKGRGQQSDMVYLADQDTRVKQLQQELGGGETMTVSELIKRIATLKNSQDEKDRTKYSKICNDKATKFYVLTKSEEQPSDAE